ncbi:AMP-binding protein [Thalassotalea montiporae]
MELILEAIKQRATSAPRQTALICDGDIPKIISNAGLLDAIAAAEGSLQAANVSCLGIYMDNCADWIVYDLAAAKLGICVIPIPLFFSPRQTQHLIANAGIDFVLLNNPKLRQVLPITDTSTQGIEVSGEHCQLVATSLASQQQKYPKNTAKITFTSGSTGEPKGVCLSYDNIETVCLSLLQAIQTNTRDTNPRHLCVMSLATLLENIAGVYLPLLSGGVVITQPIQKLGFDSNAQFDAARLIEQVARFQVASMILFPQILENLVAQPFKHLSRIANNLQFVAVGGGVVSPKVLQLAEQIGLPIFQGYGLSECGSVVCLNVPEHNKVGSVGKVLDHAQLTVNSDGELIVHGQSMLGYLGEFAATGSSIATGDLGYIDEEGYVFVTGRKKNILVSSFGRNISPEWVESILTAQKEIKQAVVIGEAEATLSTVLVLNDESKSKVNVSQILARVNAQLPDYARLGHWYISSYPFTAENGLLTANGRPKRAEILSHYENKTFSTLATSSAA